MPKPAASILDLLLSTSLNGRLHHWFFLASQLATSLVQPIDVRLLTAAERPLSVCSGDGVLPRFIRASFADTFWLHAFLEHPPVVPLRVTSCLCGFPERNLSGGLSVDLGNGVHPNFFRSAFADTFWVHAFLESPSGAKPNCPNSPRDRTPLTTPQVSPQQGNNNPRQLPRSSVDGFASSPVLYLFFRLFRPPVLCLHECRTATRTEAAWQPTDEASHAGFTFGFNAATHALQPPK